MGAIPGFGIDIEHARSVSNFLAEMRDDLLDNLSRAEMGLMPQSPGHDAASQDATTIMRQLGQTHGENSQVQLQAVTMVKAGVDADIKQYEDDDRRNTLRSA